MRTVRTLILAGVVAVCVSGVARAEEADDYTCRSRLSKDSLAILDGWINDKIREALDEANRKEGGCDAACLSEKLADTVGGSYRKVTMIPHARFTAWIMDQPNVERCHLKFSETIYGARPYDQVWRYPFSGRIIWVADSIRLAGRTVGIDKLDHFVREGLDHWHHIHDEGVADIAASMALEIGPADGRRAWTENGLKGMALTGVFAYADLAAGYFGYRFWDDLLSFGRPGSYIEYDAATHRYEQRRSFTFADCVNDAWDEGVNFSRFDPILAGEVLVAVKKLGLTMPVHDCRGLSKLPDANLYVNPACLERVQGSKGPRVPRVRSEGSSRSGPEGPPGSGSKALNGPGFGSYAVGVEPDPADLTDRTLGTLGPDPWNLWTFGPLDLHSFSICLIPFNWASTPSATSRSLPTASYDPRRRRFATS